MATVPLRAYINEIDSIIEQKQTEEAIAHCRQILHIYPKHIDTYRMLGKAYLESQRYGNAADILQRVLSAVPDDFVSHVGMSIIREDEKNLDAAIWHMERAFETQPYNAAIQGELRRLYGERDGMQPPKVHLTRGALARMYVKGDLYTQAIAELRSAIAEDPQRFDLQVLLARMYAQSNQDAMAIETCGTLINKLPYCLEANRILAQLLEKANRTEEAESYRKRVQELNPYEAYIGPNAPTEDQVPDQAVRVEQLIWDGGPAITASDQPEWATSIGIDLAGTDSLDDELPDWMAGSDEDAPAQPASHDATPEIEDDEIPDFMKEAGWAPSTGAFDESQAVIYGDEEEEDEGEMTEAVAGDIPDWLQQMAPPGAIENPDEIAEVPPDFPGDQPEIDDTSAIQGELPDWLHDTDPDASESDEVPDWLTPAAAGAAGLAAAGALSSLGDDEPSEEMETASWLENLEDQGEASLSEMAADSDMPDWLQGMAEAEEHLGPGVEAEPDEVEEVEMPDWLQEMEVEDETEEGTIPDWLQEAVDEDLPADSELRKPEVTGIPEWLSGAVEEDISTEIEGEEAETPDWLLETPEESEKAEDGEGAADILKAATIAGVAAAGAAAMLSDDEREEQEEETPETIAKEEPEEAGIPEWLSEAAEEEVFETVIEEEPEQPEEDEVPEWLFEVEEEASDIVAEEEPEASEEEEISEWLSEAAKEPAEPISEIEPEETEADEIPNWLFEAAEEESLDTVAEEVPEEPEADEVPEWLSMEPAEPISEIEPEETHADEIPDWLSEAVVEETLDTVAEEDEVPEWLSEVEEEADEGGGIDILKATGITGVAAAGAAAMLSDDEREEQEEETPETIVKEEPEEAGIPEWLSEAAEEEVFETVIEEEPEQPEEDEVPEWLFEVEEEASDIVAEEEPEQPEEEEISEWLSQAAKEPAEPISEIKPEETEADEIPDWLSEAVVEETPDTVAEDEPEQPEEDEIPDWLSEVNEEDDLQPEERTEPGLDEVDGGGIPGWLQEAIDETPAHVDDDEVEIPDWIQEVAVEEHSESFADEEVKEDQSADILKVAGIAGAAAAGIKAITSDDEKEEPSEAVELVTAETPSAEDDAPLDFDDPDAAMAWLESLAAKQGVSEDELLTSPEERSETPPEWVQEAASEAAAQETPEAEEAEGSQEVEDEEEIEWVSTTEPESVERELEGEEITTDDLPDWIQEIGDESEEAHEPEAAIEEAMADEDEIPAWLNNIGKDIPTIAGETEVPLEPVTEAPQDDIPDWLQEMESEETPEMDAISFAEAATETPPVSEEKSGEEESLEADTFDFDDPDAAMAWLESLAAKQGVSEDELLTSPEERSETPPDWVKDSLEAETVEPSATTEEMPKEPIDELISSDDSSAVIPDWITEAVESTDEEISSEAEQPVIDLPDFLQDITKLEIASDLVEEIEEAAQVSEPTSELEQSPVSELEQSPVDEEDFPDFDDADAALAWLEGLAVKQGVSEDELLTRPEDRAEAPPDWVQEASEESEPIEEAPTLEAIPAIEDSEIPDWILEAHQPEEPEVQPEISQETLPKEPVADSTPPGAITTAVEDFDLDDADAAMAWLESLAAKQGVSEEELLTRPEERSETPPAWVQEAVEEISEPEVTLTEEEIDDWMAKVAEEEEAEEPEELTVETPGIDYEIDDADAAMAWLESLAAKQGVPEEELISSPEDRADTPPDWVRDATEQQALESETPAEFESSEAQMLSTGGSEGEIPVAPPSWVTDGDIPEEEDDFSWIQSAVAEEANQLLDLNQASLIQLERLPGIGFRRAQSITAFRSQYGDFLHIDELLNVPGMDDDTFQLLKTRVYVTAPEQQAAPEEVASEPALFAPQEVEPDDASHELQVEAQSKLNEGNVSEAMVDYGSLVKKGQRLDEIIDDLNLAAGKYPAEITIFQTLGDAYMQANRLQEALDAYTKAEELLK